MHVHTMSKRRPKGKPGAPGSKAPTQASEATLEKVNVIRSSVWRHATDGSSSEDEEEEEKRHGETTSAAFERIMIYL